MRTRGDKRGTVTISKIYAIPAVEGVLFKKWGGARGELPTDEGGVFLLRKKPFSIRGELRSFGKEKTVVKKSKAKPWEHRGEGGGKKKSSGNIWRTKTPRSTGKNGRGKGLCLLSRGSIPREVSAASEVLTLKWPPGKSFLSCRGEDHGGPAVPENKKA